MELSLTLDWLGGIGDRSRFAQLSTTASERRDASGQTDEALMHSWQAGDPAAFGVLYSRFADRLFRFVSRTSASRAEAEEICQEAWLAVIEGRERYQPSARFVTYLFSIVQRRSIDRLRHNGRRREVDSVAVDEAAMPESPALLPERIAHTEQNANALLAAIAELPALQREAFLMQAEGEMSLDEIALATGSAREAVKSRLRYAMRRLRAAMANHR